MDPASLQAAAAVTSLIASGFIGVAAIIVALRANDIASKAVTVAEGARDVSRDGVEQAKRQAVLTAVPSLFAQRPRFDGTRATIEVLNGGPGVAFGVLASVAGAGDRSLDTVDEDSRKWSGRQVSLTPGPAPLRLTIASNLYVAYPWVHATLEYMSPLGAKVRHDYLGPSDVANKRYRLHRVRIEAGGVELLHFDVDLGPFDEADEDTPQPWGGVA